VRRGCGRARRRSRRRDTLAPPPLRRRSRSTDHDLCRCAPRLRHSGT
jgi:hypothetical protein